MLRYNVSVCTAAACAVNAGDVLQTAIVLVYRGSTEKKLNLWCLELKLIAIFGCEMLNENSWFYYSDPFGTFSPLT